MNILDNDIFGDKFRKLITDPSFLYLDRWQKSRQIFDIINANEMNHSAMIAWLLDPNEAHGQGSFFLRHFFYNLAGNCPDRLTFDFIESLNFQNFIVQVEVVLDDKNRIDILICDPTSKTMIIIENKYGAKTEKNQLENYQDWAIKKYQNEKFKDGEFYLVFMDGLASDIEIEKGWVPIDYEWLIASLKSVIGRSIFDRDIEKIINDYYIELTGDYSLEVQFADYEKHFSILAERHSGILSSLRNENININNYNFKQYLFSENAKTPQWFDILYRNRRIFRTLSDYSQYDIMKKNIKCECCYDQKSGKFFIMPVSFNKYVSKSDPHWPIYLQLNKNKEDNNYELSLVLRKQYTGEEGKSLINKIAYDHGKKFRKNQSRMPISISPLMKWDTDQMATEIDKQLEKLRDVN